MRIYLVGVSCVGKTAAGMLLAEKTGYEFVDFDEETKKEFGKPLLALHNQFLSNKGYREYTKPLLARILDEHKDDVVIAMPPGGMFREYKTLLDKQHPDVVTVWLKDRPRNIFNRLVFTDDYDNLITEPVINADNAAYYLDDVRKDIEYFSATHKKAAVHCDIEGLDANGAAEKIIDMLGLARRAATR